MKPPTPQQVSKTFDKVLAAIMANKLDGCPTDTGLRSATVDALNAIAGAKDKAAAADHARQVFDRGRV